MVKKRRTKNPGEEVMWEAIGLGGEGGGKGKGQ